MADQVRFGSPGGVCRAMCAPWKTTFCSLGLWVARRKLVLPGLTPHPSPLPAGGGGEICSSSQTPLLLSFPETAEGFTKCVHCSGTGNYSTLWWVVECLEERRGWGTEPGACGSPCTTQPAACRCWGSLGHACQKTPPLLLISIPDCNQQDMLTVSLWHAAT